MTEPANRPPLLNAFDALSDRGPPRDVRATGLPLSIIALVVALIGGLFVAIVIEDRQLQREALHRDADSAASQLTTRLGALTEALTTTALEIGNGTVAERRFASIARDLSVAKPELLRLKRVDDTGRVVWLPDAPPAPAPAQPIEPALDAALRAARDQRAPVTVLLDPVGAPGSTMLALVAPIQTDARPAGALVARVSLAELLRHGLNSEIRERYRFELHAGPRALASSGPSTLPADLPTAEAALAPYGPDLRLLAIAYRSGTPLAGRALVWVVAGLSIAVAIALLTLMKASSRQARVDRALLAEASLRRAMEQSLATGLRVIDRDGVIRYVNRAFCQMTGWTEAQLVGCAPPYPYWPAEHREEHEAQLERLLAGEPTDAAVEVVVQRPDGSRFDARMYVSPLVDDNERQIGWMTSMTDITEPKRIRNELAAAHQQFTTMLESLDAAVSVVSTATDGELLFANRAYRERLGLGADGHRKLASRLRRAGDASGGAELFDEESGRWFDVRLRSIRWPGSGGDVAGRDAELQIASDITLRKATEDIVRQQQEKVQFTSRLMTMGEMASSLAHELNQPLTAIANYSEGITARVRAGEIPREQLLAALDKTSVQAQRAGRIIRRIREFVKRSEPRRRPTAAARVVEDAIGFAEIEAAKKRIAIAVDIDPALPPLDIDPLLIEQVLLNLLKNAIDAMGHASVRRIDVRVGRADAEGMAEFAVTDRGSGIPPEHLPNLFQPFFSTKEEGMGMGLNICRSIIEFHHGRLLVEPNPEPAGGTVMRFTLPIAGSSDATVHDADAADRPAPAKETQGP